ncbi:MAG: DUF3221 domain-containing protein [Paenibacillaceae bacterium]
MSTWMRRALSLLLLIVVIVSLIGCNSDVSGEPNLIGRVVDRDGGRILVIGGISREEISGNIQNILESGEYKEAYWVRVSGFKRFEEGDQVKVWFSETEDSYPAQTAADKIEIVEE